jgi:transcription elongation factor Elf1
VADFNCPHCKAEYSVAYETGFKETGAKNCDHCGKQMAAWKDARPPIYVLRKRPDDDRPP